MQVFLEKNINKLHNLFFDQLRMYFSNTLLSFSYKKCTQREKECCCVYMCTHSEKGENGYHVTKGLAELIVFVLPNYDTYTVIYKFSILYNVNKD